MDFSAIQENQQCSHLLPSKENRISYGHISPSAQFLTFCLPIFFLVNVHMPKDRITQLHQGYGFIEFLGEEDADYAIKVMNMIKVYGKPIRVNKVDYA